MPLKLLEDEERYIGLELDDLYSQIELPDPDQRPYPDDLIETLFNHLWISRDLDVEKIVFTGTSFLHPKLIKHYTDGDLYEADDEDDEEDEADYWKKPKEQDKSTEQDEPTVLQLRSSQTKAVKTILNILDTGEHPRRESMPGPIQEYKQKNNSYFDFITGALGSIAQETVFGQDMDFAVYVGFDIDQLEVVKPGEVYKFQNPKNKQKAVKIVGGFYIGELFKDVPEGSAVYQRKDGVMQFITDDNLLWNDQNEVICLNNGFVRAIGSISPEKLKQTPPQRLEKAVTKNLLKGNIVIGDIINGEHIGSPFYIDESPIERI